MDEMRIKLSTKFMRNIISKIAANLIAKKIGIRPAIDINEITLEKKGEKIHAHLNLDAEITERDLLKITRLTNLINEDS